MGIITGILILGILVFIVEVLSIALKITGLDIDKARFQVISIITNTGFTTKEAELVTQHPTRRKIAQVLMLISYVGYATIIGIVVNIFQGNYQLIYLAGIIIALLLVVLVFIRNKWIGNKLEILIEGQLLKRMKKMKKHRNVEEVLKLNDEYGVAEFIIETGSRLQGKTLMESGLSQRFIQVLNVDRGSHIVHFPRTNFIFNQGDKITVYGHLENIKKLVLEQYVDEDKKVEENSSSS